MHVFIVPFNILPVFPKLVLLLVAESQTHTRTPHWLRQMIKHTVGADYKILRAHNFKDRY